MTAHHPALLLAGPLLVGSVLAGRVEAFQQFTYSISYEGASIAQTVSGAATPITEADLLTFGPGAPGFGPLGAPSLALGGDQFGLSLYSQCQGHLPGQPCGIEVDSVSQGRDELALGIAGLAGTPGISPERVWFSVDEWASGHPGLSTPPHVLSESGPVGDVSADVFVEFTLGPGPTPPGLTAGQHVGVFDGDGVPSAQPSGRVYPGLGLIEPNAPMPGLPDRGDDLDSLDIDALPGFPPSGYYLSLDSAFLDPLEGVPNSGSAAAMGFSGADVLRVAAPAAAPGVFAPATALGLDLVAGVDSDDLDAMILAENGDGVFQPSQIPFDWAGGTTDMLLFSVRRGSAVIGLPDSIFGAPIEEGDILTTPLPTALGGLSPFPGIFHAAESLGLATARTHGVGHGDDLNAMDLAAAACFDCNNNGVEDAVDISTGGSSDTNDNGIPDECERISEYCVCPGGSSPCGNGDAGAGCANSTTDGAHLFFQGTSSVGADDLTLVTELLPANQFGVYYMGGSQISLPFGDGLRCVGSGGVGTHRFPSQSSGGGGLATSAPGIVSHSCGSFPPAGCITAGSTWNFQFWYRDPTGPCGNGFNFSNGLQVDFVP